MVIMTAALASAQTVSFSLEDYVTLGNIEDKLRPAYEELQVQQSRTQGTNSYASELAAAMSASGDLFVGVNKLTILTSNLATAFNTLSAVRGAIKAKDLDGVAASLSPISLTEQRTYITDLENRLFTLNEQILDPIDPSRDLLWYYAVVASCRSRAQIESFKTIAQSAQASLDRALVNSAARWAEVDALDKSAAGALQAVQALERIVEPLVAVPGGEYLLVSLVAYEIDVRNLLTDISGLKSRLGSATNRLGERASQVDELNQTLDYLLAAPSLSSSWSTTGDMGGANAFFNLVFEGREFSQPCTEINGPFLLGKLHITNYITPVTGGTTLTPTVGFSLRRIVHDPVLGERVTDASVALSMQYTATPNTEDPVASRDYFTVATLGIRALIYETATQTFDVWGQYDSPLRVVAVTPSAGPDSGFVEPFAYPLHVSGGTGSGVYPAGTPVTIEAADRPGHDFIHWEDETGTWITDAGSHFTYFMPPRATTLYAVYHETPQRFRLEVVNGSGSGEYVAGTLVGIAADLTRGVGFLGWSGDSALISAPRATSSHVRLIRDASIKAEFRTSDECPEDPAKIAMGICGCGLPDADSDGDGIQDCRDACPRSDTTAIIRIGGCDTHVKNRWMTGGCTMLDRIQTLAATSRDHGQFVSSVTLMLHDWARWNWISKTEETAIHDCAVHAPVPGKKGAIENQANHIQLQLGGDRTVRLNVAELVPATAGPLEFMFWSDRGWTEEAPREMSRDAAGRPSCVFVVPDTASAGTASLCVTVREKASGEELATRCYEVELSGDRPTVATGLAGLRLLQLGPNPARDEIRLRYSSDRSAPAHLTLFDVAGRRVAERVLPELPAGEHLVVLKDEIRSLPANLYMLRVEQAGRYVTGRILLTH